jgi:hypothetical protein
MPKGDGRAAHSLDGPARPPNAACPPATARADLHRDTGTREARHPTDRNTRFWMVGIRFRDDSRRLVHHYYLVTAAYPSRALEYACLRSSSTAERDARKGAPPDGTWWEISEIITDFSVHLRKNVLSSTH